MVALEANGRALQLPPPPFPPYTPHTTIPHHGQMKLWTNYTSNLTKPCILAPGRKLHIAAYSSSPAFLASLLTTANTSPLQMSSTMLWTSTTPFLHQGSITSMPDMATHQVD